MAPRKAIIKYTHILEEVDAVCTNTAIINKGKIIFSGTPRQLSALSNYHDALNIVVTTEDAEKSLKILKEQTDISHIEEIYSGNEIRITAILRNKEPLASSLRKILDENNIFPKEYFFEKGRLDQVFRDLTKTEEISTKEVL